MSSMSYCMSEIRLANVGHIIATALCVRAFEPIRVRVPVGGDFSQQKIAIAEFFTYALEFVLRRHHFLDVAQAIVEMADGADVTARLDHPVHEGRDVACPHESLACHFEISRHVPLAHNMAITACTRNLCDCTGCGTHPATKFSPGTSVASVEFPGILRLRM
ncbi:hypothetical protein ACFSQT_11350 [Mesorhizobium calcicola]|uniref:Uncharacterized protein n=1 Tax=Mesorhizobium calcicola TaxID=1300310 RepID=A0ABW4WC02_9HYPH